MQKKLMKAEIGGILFIISMSVFLRSLYSLCNRELIGVLFGSVNDSIWEICKTILLPYIIWSMIELLSFRPPFRKFAVIKIFTLYALAISYIAMCLIFSIFNSEPNYIYEFTVSIVCISVISFLSYRLLFSDIQFEKLFYPAFFMLILFIAFYCSFTPFPPKNFIFMDRATSLYGIIPEYIDKGAIVLDTIYYI